MFKYLTCFLFVLTICVSCAYTESNKSFDMEINDCVSLEEEVLKAEDLERFDKSLDPIAEYSEENNEPSHCNWHYCFTVGF